MNIIKINNIFHVLIFFIYLFIIISLIIFIIFFEENIFHEKIQSIK